MANHLLPKGCEKILSKLLDFSPTSTDVFKALLVTSAHTPSDADEFLSDISSGHRLGLTGQLTSMTITGGVFDVADATWTALVSGNTGTYIYILKDTGTAGTSALVCFIDTGSNLPIPTNGGDIACVFNASGIFAIAS